MTALPALPRPRWPANGGGALSRCSGLANRNSRHLAAGSGQWTVGKVGKARPSGQEEIAHFLRVPVRVQGDPIRLNKK